MITDPRLPPPKNEAEALTRFREAWARAERAIATRDEVERFLAKWDRLTDDARDAIELGARYEFGDDIVVDDVLRRAIHGWTVQQNREELRAEAFRTLVDWWERDGREARAWRKDTGNSAFTDWAVEKMRECGAATSEGKIEGLMKHLAR